MRPRQNLRDFQHNTPSSYQHLNNNPNLVQQHQQQSMAPPPTPQSSTMGASAPSQPPLPTLPTPDLIAELIKLGLNPEELAKQSNRPMRGREDVFKNLQAILGKREVAELLQKLPPLTDWPMQSITPPEFSRVVGGGNISGIGGVCSRDSVICGPSGIVGSGGGATGAVSFSNNITNNGNSSQQEQESQFASAQHQATASAINHHQHFRIPTTNTTTLHNSPQQQQHKSVLSIHQQQHQHDPTNRRLNHQHNLSTTPNSVANLNNLSRAPSSSSSSSSSSTNSAHILDSLNSNIYNRKTSPPVTSYTLTSASSTQRVPNIMDTLGGSFSGGITGPGLDNIYDNPAFQQQSNLSSRENLVNQQQSLIRHQQLQRLLRASSAGGAKNASSSTSSLSARSDQQNSQRNSSNNYSNNMSQIQRQLTSPNTSSAISPPQPTVPKSLLNLAACSSSPPATNSISSLTSGNRLSRNVNTNQPANYHNNSGNMNVSTNNRTLSRGNSNTGPSNVFNSRVPSGVDPSNLLQHMMVRSSQVKSTNTGTINRSNPTNQTLTSLLSDDQKNPRSTYNPMTSQLPSGHGRASSQPTPRRQSQNLNDETNTAHHSNAKTKEAYLAYLQERAAKAGISIGEIKKTPTIHLPNQTNAPQQDQPSVDSFNLLEKNESDRVCDKNDIESALSQVEARNDLSLLYPPISLALNSQKQVNAISAGLVSSNELDIFTDEVKMIVQEECNIIYECKGCSNLFRSLANLVKHKRTYCNDTNTESANFELNRRVNILNSSIDLSVTKTTQSSEPNNNYGHLGNCAIDKSVDDQRRQLDPIDATVPNQKHNMRSKNVDINTVGGDIRSTQTNKNQDRRDHGDRSLLVTQETGNSSNTNDNTYGSPTKQTNLSRLLQSQPKNRPLAMKDSALMDALNMLPSAPSGNKLSVITSKGKSCSINELNEQLVRNSSLAKTLLSEKAKTISSGQSLIDFSGSEASVVQKIAAAPKRKLLEDCIQKVKRDKLVPGDDVNPSTNNSMRPRSDFGGSLQIVDETDDHPMDDLGQFKDPLAIDDSGTDSDALVMDFDESCTPTRRKQDSKPNFKGRTRSTSAATSSTTNNKLNSSSALLKALTRPVETRSAFVSNQRSNEDKTVPETEAVSNDIQKTSTSAIEIESCGLIPVPTSIQENNTENLIAESRTDNNFEQDQEIPPPSPLFDNYTCEICALDFENQSALLDHILDTHKDEKKIYPCIFCSFSFITLENVCRHIIDMHKKTKTQVGRLKDVVLSRSFISSDFATCSDHPSIPSTSQETVETDVSIKSKIEPISPANTRRNSSALSDTTTAQQILEDTLAMVSDAPNSSLSTTASSQRLASIMSRARSAERRLSSSNSVNDDNLQSITEADNPLSDSVVTSVTDDHLPILEGQEADRLRQELGSTGCVVHTKDEETSEIKSSQSSYLDDTGGGYSHQDHESLEHEVGQDVESIKHEMVDPMIIDSNDAETSAEQEHNVAIYDSTDQDDNSTEDNDIDNWQNDDNPDRPRKVRETSVLSDLDGSVPEAQEHSGSVPDENDNEPKLELTEHQINPSKGKHIIVNQLFDDNQQNSDQEDQCDDEQNFDESYSKGPAVADQNESESQDGATESQSSSSSDGDSSSSDNETSTGSSSSSSSNSRSSSRSSSSSSSSSSSNDASSIDDSILEGDPEEEEAEANEDEGVEEEEEDDDEEAEDYCTPGVTSGEARIKDRPPHCASGSSKGDTDLISSQTSDKSTSQQDYNDIAPSRNSSRAISKSAKMDNCKLKVKSALRDVCGSGGSSASTASSSGPGNAAGAGGSGTTGSSGIMKLKIQLKTQPDEKRSKVYRIVE